MQPLKTHCWYSGDDDLHGAMHIFVILPTTRPPLKSRMFCHSGIGLPRLSWLLNKDRDYDDDDEGRCMLCSYYLFTCRLRLAACYDFVTTASKICTAMILLRTNRGQGKQLYY